MAKIFIDKVSQRKAAQALRLLKAFMQIGDQSVRDAILTLAETRAAETSVTPVQKVSRANLTLTGK